MSTELVVAGVSFLVSLGTAVYTSRIDRGEKDFDALRTYRFEARKRLYEQCEPLLFQLAEAAEIARGRIHGFARECREGDLRAKLTAEDKYYLMSSIYRLLAPIAVFQLLRRRLTSVDFAVDARIKAQYDLGRVLYRSFRDDFNIADEKPLIEYKRDQHAQGIVWGKLDAALEVMVANDTVISFGRFEKEFTECAAFRDIEVMFASFHPATHPVLWRMLLAQVQIYETLLAIHRSHGDAPELPRDLRGAQLTKVALRKDNVDKTEPNAAMSYIVERLAS